MQPSGVGTEALAGRGRDQGRARGGVDRETQTRGHQGVDGEKYFKENFYVKKYTEYSRIY